MPEPELTFEERGLVLRVIVANNPKEIRVWRTKAGYAWLWFRKEDNTEYRTFLTHVRDDGLVEKIQLDNPMYHGGYLNSQMAILSTWTEIDIKGILGEQVMPKKNNFRRYTHTDDGHNKYWEIWMPNSSAVTTHWGAIGNDGNSLTKNFGSEREATTQYNRLCRAKVTKGYILEVQYPERNKLDMPKLPPEPKPLTASEEGLSEVMDILDIE